MSEGQETTISIEEYTKLQLDYIESQKELKELTELFEQYREETESMEEVQSRQVEMLEQQLEKANLEKEYLMLSLKKELQEISLETQKLLTEKDEELQKLRLDIKVKTLAMTKFMSDYSDNKEKEKALTNDENEPKNEQDKDQTIIKMKKEIAVKDFLINDLSVDIKKNKDVIEEQKALFKKFSAEILEKTKERDDALKSLKDQQIDELKRLVEEKEQLIEQLEKENDPGVSQEENDLMREMIVQQQDKLLSLTKNFEGDESEKLFLAQIQLRDAKIKQLEAQVLQQTQEGKQAVVVPAAAVQNTSNQTNNIVGYVDGQPEYNSTEVEETQESSENKSE